MKYIRNNKYDELSSGRIDLNDFDPVQPGQNGGDPSSAYDDFEERYGIGVQSVQLKSIKLPPQLQKLYDDKAEEEKKKEAQRIRLEAEQERAEAEARMMDIKTAAEARRARELAGAPIQGLQGAGISTAAIEQNVGVLSAKNSVFFGGGVGQSSDTAKGVAAGVFAGNVASQNSGNTTDTQVSHAASLVRMIDYAFQSGFVLDDSSESYLKLKDMLLNNNQLIDLVNSFSNEEIAQLRNHILSGNLSGRSLAGLNGKSKTRK